MSWTHLSDTKPKARKRYNCELCGQPIEPGQQHVARRGVCDGDMVTARMHIYCESVTRVENWNSADWECYDEAEFYHYVIVEPDITDLDQPMVRGETQEPAPR